jgi:hypothetical protein
VIPGRVLLSPAAIRPEPAFMPVWQSDQVADDDFDFA